MEMQTISHNISILIILNQHINCNADGKYCYKNLQSLNRDFAGEAAAEPNADAVGDDDQGQETEGAFPVNSGEVADAGWYCDEHGIKKGYAYCDSGGDSAGYQKGHYQDGTARAGQGADGSGDDAQENQENYVVGDVGRCSV